MTPAEIDRVFGRGRLRMTTGEHVEVFREEAREGEERRYTKRFLETANGDFRPWTEREWRILDRLGARGDAAVARVVRFFPADDSGIARLQTRDAGPTVDQWAALVPLRRTAPVLPYVFGDCANWWALARQCLIALDPLHALGFVHLDFKPDNVCIPAKPAQAARPAAGQPLAPDFEALALIDVAFSLLPGVELPGALPVAREPGYEYQSPRLVQALEEGRRGNLAPTLELDWRCDVFSLAATLWRYLPELDDAAGTGWTTQRHALATSFVRQLLEIHAEPVSAERPHRDLIGQAALRLSDPQLAAALQAGSSFDPDRSWPHGAEAMPLTRVVPTLATRPAASTWAEPTFAAPVAPRCNAASGGREADGSAGRSRLRTAGRRTRRPAHRRAGRCTRRPADRLAARSSCRRDDGGAERCAGSPTGRDGAAAVDRTVRSVGARVGGGRQRGDGLCVQRHAKRGVDRRCDHRCRGSEHVAKRGRDASATRDGARTVDRGPDHRVRRRVGASNCDACAFAGSRAAAVGQRRRFARRRHGVPRAAVRFRRGAEAGFDTGADPRRGRRRRVDHRGRRVVGARRPRDVRTQGAAQRSAGGVQRGVGEGGEHGASGNRSSNGGGPSVRRSADGRARSHRVVRRRADSAADGDGSFCSRGGERSPGGERVGHERAARRRRIRTFTHARGRTGACDRVRSGRGRLDAQPAARDREQRRAPARARARRRGEVGRAAPARRESAPRRNRHARATAAAPEATAQRNAKRAASTKRP